MRAAARSSTSAISSAVSTVRWRPIDEREMGRVASMFWGNLRWSRVGESLRWNSSTRRSKSTPANSHIRAAVRSGSRTRSSYLTSR
jgi:hypothetical protein